MPSSVIAAMHYDAAAKTLWVRYLSGASYIYKNVPPEVYEEMKAAFSKGTFLNKRIKGHYKFEKCSS